MRKALNTGTVEAEQSAKAVENIERITRDSVCTFSADEK